MKSLLFKPFEKFSETRLLAFGIVSTLIGTYLGFLCSVRFDGVLDMHIVPEIQIGESIMDSIVNIGSLFLLLFVVAKIINKKTRVIDIITTALVARTPLYVLALSNLNSTLRKANEAILESATTESFYKILPSDVVVIVIFALISILLLIWYVALLYNGYKVACNAKGKTHVLFFILALLMAEVLSKILINL
jgi:hypothetical protein